MRISERSLLPSNSQDSFSLTESIFLNCSILFFCQNISKMINFEKSNVRKMNNFYTSVGVFFLIQY